MATFDTDLEDVITKKQQRNQKDLPGKFESDDNDFLAEFDRCTPEEGNKLLFLWIETRQHELLEQLAADRPVLKFWSYAPQSPSYPYVIPMTNTPGYAYLLTDPVQVRSALANWSMVDHQYSGDFILSIDDKSKHEKRRRTLVHKLQDPTIELKIETAVELAWKEVSQYSTLENSDVAFDMLKFARTTALHFVAAFFGLPESKVTDESAMAKWNAEAFNEYIWKIHARHFVKEHPEAGEAVEGISGLIKASFATAPRNSVIGRFRADPGAFVTAGGESDYKAMGSNILGCIQGLVDNVTNSTCFAYNQFSKLSSPSAKNPVFSRDELLAAARERTGQSLENYLLIAHQHDAPVPFLPRHANPDLDPSLSRESELAGAHVACALGPAVRQVDFSSPNNGPQDCRMGIGRHDCIGKYLGDKLAVTILRKALLAGQISEVVLKKKWGWLVDECYAPNKGKTVNVIAGSMTPPAKVIHEGLYIQPGSNLNSQGVRTQLDSLLNVPIEHIPFLTIEELGSVPPATFKLLSAKQVGSLTPQQINSLNPLQCQTLYGITQKNPNVEWDPEQTSALEKRMSFFAVYSVTNKVAPRPHAYSLWSSDPNSQSIHEYVTWAGLVDKKFTARHLPPLSEDTDIKFPVDIAFDSVTSHGDVTALFKRDEALAEPSRSTLLFPIFAQWLTDSFLRTDTVDRRRNTSSHQIDMCQIYGLNDEVSSILRDRKRKGGRLLSEDRDGNEYPPRLFDVDGNVKPEFKRLPYVINGHVNEVKVISRKKNYLVSGLARGNATFGNAAMNTLFLREHNRLCGVLSDEFSGWDDERLFQTTRLIVMLLELKIIVSEYINHISAPSDTGSQSIPRRLFKFDSNFAEDQKWYRPNHIALEFTLLYRWHCLVPNAVFVADKKYELNQYVNFNDPLIEHGLDEVLLSASAQNIDKPALFTTPDMLLRAEYAALKMSRDFRVQPFNSYRSYFQLEKISTFEDLGCTDEVTEHLNRVYPGGVDTLDFLVGLYAERAKQGSVFGDLMTAMVAHDAFTQALTNPLLSRNVTKLNTITHIGQAALDDTESLNDLWQRNRDVSSDKGRRAGDITMDFYNIQQSAK